MIIYVYDKLLNGIEENQCQEASSLDRAET